MFVPPPMEDRKKHARGLEEVSHFFLSSQSATEEARNLIREDVKADACEITTVPDGIALYEGVQGELYRAPVKRSSCLLFSSISLFEEKSFIACNLALELARRDFSIGLIETTTRAPNSFFLMGSLFPVPPTPPALAPLRLIDITIGAGKNIKAVFLEKDFGSSDSFTILDRLKSESDFLIINASPAFLGLRKMISFINPFFIVPTTVRSEELLNSYSLIKRTSLSVSRGEVGLLIMEERFCQKTEAAFRVLAEMAQRFLSCKIRFMGSIPKGADLSQAILTRTPLFLEGENSSISQSIRKLADGLIQENTFI